MYKHDLRNLKETMGYNNLKIKTKIKVYIIKVLKRFQNKR